MNITQQLITQLGFDIIGAAIEVHQELGPGLLESVYEECMMHELELMKLKVERQAVFPLFYKGKKLKDVLKLDLLVEDLIVVELKAVKELLPVHSAQLLTYMEIAEAPKGILINFNTDNITRHAVHRVNGLYNLLPAG